MTITHGFWNSLDHDRPYSAEQMGSLFEGIIDDGIFGAIGGSLIVSANDDMTVDVAAGRAWFDNTWTNSDSVYVLPIPTASAVYGRIDAVVLEVDKNESIRANSIKIVEGSPASSPAKPVLANSLTDPVSSTDVYQYPLCYITVGISATVITASEIENVIGTSECPLIVGALVTLSADDMVAQFENEFDDWLDDEQVDFTAWFDEMKDQLSVDAAGALQVQIDAVEDALVLENASSSLTNKSGADHIAGAVVIPDPDNGSSFDTTVIFGRTDVAVLVEAADIDAPGRVTRSGLRTIAVAGNIVTGDRLVSSITAGKAVSNGSHGKGFAVAVTPYTGSSGTVLAIMMDVDGVDLAETDAAVTTTKTLNLASYESFLYTLTGNVTLTFTNAPSGGVSGFSLLLKQDGTGSRVATFPASVLWPGNIVPEQSAGASDQDWYVFWTPDGGTTWYGSQSGADYS